MSNIYQKSLEIKKNHENVTHNQMKILSTEAVLEIIDETMEWTNKDLLMNYK